MSRGERVGYPVDHQPLMEPPASGCEGCPCCAVCRWLQPDEEVLCELTDDEAEIDPNADPGDWWLNKVAETPANRRGLSWRDESAAD